MLRYRLCCIMLDTAWIWPAYHGTAYGPYSASVRDRRRAPLRGPRMLLRRLRDFQEVLVHEAVQQVLEALTALPKT